MSHKTQIGLHLGFKFLLVFAGNAGIHIFLRAITYIRPPRLDIRSEKEYALFTSTQDNFSLMELQSEVIVEKISNTCYGKLQNFPVRMEEYHIIHIPAIIFHAESVFHKMVECMQVKIPENLTHEVSEW